MKLRPTIIVGLALIAIAALWVGSGVPFKFAVTYPECVATRTESCTPLSAIDMHCNHIAIICTKYRPHISPWVVIWLIESGVVIVIAAAFGIVYSSKLKGPTLRRPEPTKRGPT
jgi:hypothetical protein